MPEPSAPADVVRALVTGVAAGMFAELPRLYADATHVSHPFAAGSRPLRSREELAQHFAAVAAAAARSPAREVADLVIHQTTDPEVVVAEFAYRWHLPEPMSVRCVFIVRVRDGEIVESRDYIDPAARARIDERMAQLASGAANETPARGRPGDAARS